MLYLPLYFLPKHHVIQAVRLGARLALRTPVTEGNCTNRGYEDFLHVRKAELVRDLGDLGGQALGELNVLTISQFGPPVLTVRGALIEVGPWKVELAVKSARALCDSWVEAIEVIGGTNHHYAFVGHYAVDLIQEVGAYFVGDQGVQVFEDKQAWSFGTRLVKYRLYTSFRTHVGLKTFDV